MDVEVELLALPELAIVVLLGGGKDFEALCAAEFNTSMILLGTTCGYNGKVEYIGP